MVQQTYDWATQTPEQSPVIGARVPLRRADEHFFSFQKVCHPIFEQMLARLASIADALENSHPSVRHELIQNLCQPYFQHVSETLCREISSVDLLTQCEVDVQKKAMSQCFDKPRLSLGQRLGFWDDDSTDADDGSAFASLFGSDGEECALACRREAPKSSQLAYLRPSPAPELEEDLSSLRDADGTLMVCRHWKAKGWCRYDSQCKFQHPEHKRGIGATDMRCIPSSVPNRSGRRRGGKNRCEKSAQDFSAEHAFDLTSKAYNTSIKGYCH
jgi:hypothetical protein